MKFNIIKNNSGLCKMLRWLTTNYTSSKWKKKKNNSRWCYNNRWPGKEGGEEREREEVFSLRTNKLISILLFLRANICIYLVASQFGKQIKALRKQIKRRAKKGGRKSLVAPFVVFKTFIPDLAFIWSGDLVRYLFETNFFFLIYPKATK